MNKTAYLIGYLNKQSGILQEAGTAAMHPGQVWNDLSPESKANIIGMLSGGALGGTAGYLAGNSIVKDDDSKLVSRLKKQVPMMLGAGTGAVAGGVAGAGINALSKII